MNGAEFLIAVPEVASIYTLSHLRLGIAGAFCYEALRVPPLLPEYLPKTVQIVVESTSTDWSALIAAGLFTLLGAFLGALYGGRSAYKNTFKAQNAAIKRQKLEEALALVFDIESQAGPLSHVVSMVAVSEGWKPGKVDKLRKLGQSINLEEVHRLKVLLKVYDGKSLFYNANVLHVLLFRIKSQASSLGSKPFEEECLTIQKSALDVISRLKELREELIACLKL
ncbi:hypothetical protein RVM27_00365 [Halomonas sp. KM007]